MKRNAYALSIGMLVLYLGCVVVPDEITARIYIDIRHIQEQADKALDYVEGKTDAPPELAPIPDEPQTQSFLRDAIQFISPVRVAHAQEMKESSARATQILTAMRQRHSELEAAKATGAVGENNRGMAELVYPDKITDAEKRNEVQRLVAAENEDRKAYYQEIARLNKDENLTIATVERVYAQRRLMRGRAGELFQMPPAGEDLNTFLESAMGKKVASEATAGAWVVLK